MISLKQSVTQTGLQRLFLHKLQGDHMWSQTSSYLNHEISLYPAPSWTARFTLKLIKAIYFTGFPALKETACFACMVCHCWNCERSWTFPRVPLWSLPALPATMRLAVPSWEGCGARACKPLWGRGSWHHKICGSGAGCQATRAPFFFWKKTRFLNTKMLH